MQKYYNTRTVIKEENASGAALATTGQPVLPERASNRDIHQEPKQGRPGEEEISHVQSKVQDSSKHTETIYKEEDEAETSSQEDDIALIGQEDRLRKAYQELKEEGQRISGRLLAQRAHVRRSTCLEWLRTYDEDEQQGPIHTPAHEQDTEPLTQVNNRTDIIVAIEQEH